MPKISTKFDRGHPLWGHQMQVGWVKISDYPHISKTVHDRRLVYIKVEYEVVRVRRTVLEFYTLCNFSATVNARDFKFCTRVGHAKSWSCDEWVFPKWAWSRSREQFLHCGLRKFRHSKSSVYRWYTQLDRRRFVYDTLPPTKPPTSYHRFGQDLSYK